MLDWKPKRTYAEVDAIIQAPGSICELETRIIDGRLYRVYKNLFPSLRVFWLQMAQQHAAATYIVYENQRLTYQQVFERSVKAAAMYKDVYGVRKGDRVCICSRNYPEYIIAFWACHMIGAVSVLANAWSPLDVLCHCLARTECKVVIVDSERADLLESSVPKLAADTGTTEFLVLGAYGAKRKWKGMQLWEDALNGYKGDPKAISTNDPGIVPEDHACILFTSGTTGLPKGVLITQRQWLTILFSFLASNFRSILRRGDDLPVPGATGPQQGVLLPVPLFHVTGCSALMMTSTLLGLRIVLMYKWDTKEAARLIKAENITRSGGVPSMVLDLINGDLEGYPLESVMFGGAIPPENLPEKVLRTFPTAMLSQGYGLTETCALTIGAVGEDLHVRPTSCGIATPVNDIIIMNDDKEAPTGTIGEIWLRGPNIMKEYWRDPVETEKAITKDGWFKTGDLGYVDKEGFVYVRDRIKDIIIRGGENITSVTVENALYADPHVVEAAAIGVPDPRLGELVAAVVTVRPENRNKVSEQSLLVVTQKRLPRFAIPVMILIQDQPFEQTASGKILKAKIRDLARAEWKKRVSEKKIASKL